MMLRDRRGVGGAAAWDRLEVSSAVRAGVGSWTVKGPRAPDSVRPALAPGVALSCLLVNCAQTGRQLEDQAERLDEAQRRVDDPSLSASERARAVEAFADALRAYVKLVERARRCC